MGIRFRGKTINAVRRRRRDRTACIMDKGFRLAVNRRGRVLSTKSNCCITPGGPRNYIYLRTNILVSAFAPVQTSFLWSEYNVGLPRL